MGGGQRSRTQKDRHARDRQTDLLRGDPAEEDEIRVTDKKIDCYRHFVQPSGNPKDRCSGGDRGGKTFGWARISRFAPKMKGRIAKNPARLAQSPESSG